MNSNIAPKIPGYYPGYEIERLESEGGPACESPKEKELKMEEIPIIDLEGDNNAQEQERDEKYKESEAVRET